VGIGGAKRVVENFNRRKTGDVLFQNPKRLGMRFEAINLRGGKEFPEKEDRSADVAADVEDDVWSQGWGQIIFGFAAATEQHLIDSERIGRRRAMKDVAALAGTLLRRKAAP